MVGSLAQPTLPLQQITKCPVRLYPSRGFSFRSGALWLIFLSSLDIMLTWVILRNGGEEVNPVAKLVIDAWGLNGAIAFKFALTLFVIVACEAIARVRPVTARLLIWFGVLISSFPPVWSIFLLIAHGSES